MTVLISACWSTISFSFLTGQISLHAAYYFAHLNTYLLTHNCCTASLSPNQRCIPIGEQWYQLPEFVPSNSNSGLHSCISISIHTLHVTQIAKLIHYLQLCTGTNIHTCAFCADYWVRATSTNK